MESLSGIFDKICSVTGFWRNKEPEVTKLNPIMDYINEIFKHVVSQYTWYFYAISGIMLSLCGFYYLCDYKRRADMRRQQEEIQRMTERTSQPRRPGAIHRDHEIFRNVVQTVHEYTNPEENTTTDNEKAGITLRTIYPPNDENILNEEDSN